MDEYELLPDPKKELLRLTNSANLVWTSRGSSAIRLAFKLAKKYLEYQELNGRELVLYTPDQGGWMTYEKDAKKAGFEFHRFKTEDGVVKSISELDELKEGSVLLINSMPGYYALQPMHDIIEFCKSKNILVINDVSGSIGRNEAQYGNICVGSFGRWKPLELGKGGFLTTTLDVSGVDEQEEPLGLAVALKDLPEKIRSWSYLRKGIIADLKEQGYIVLEGEGINLIVPVDSDAERNNVTKWCEEKNLPVTECPREIRVLRNAVSIELKRLNPLN